MKLTNEDKKKIKDALACQIENILCGISDKSGYQKELEHLDSPEGFEAIKEYALKILGFRA